MEEVREPYSSEKRRSIVALAAILVVTALAFWPVLSADFTNWDDPKFVTQNGLIRDLSPGGIARMFTSLERDLYIPLVWLSYAIDYRLWGLNPFGFHLHNLLLHLLATALVFWLVRALTRSLVPAFVAGLLFGVHTLHVESVAWVTERRDLLSASLFFAAVILYLRFLRSKSIATYLWVLFLFSASLLSKPTAVTFPLVCVLLILYERKRISWKELKPTIPLFFGSLIIGALTFYIQFRPGAAGAERAGRILENLLMASKALFFYLYKTALPARLSAFYPYPAQVNLLDPVLLTCGFAAVALIFLTVWSFRFNRFIAFGLSFFLVTIFLLLRLIPTGFDFAADRNMYIPSAGLFFLAGKGAQHLWEKRRGRLAKVLVVILLVSITLSLSYLTYRRTRVWRNSVALWKDVVSKYPESYLGHYNLGDAYFQLGFHLTARDEYLQALRIRPEHPQIHFSLANACIALRLEEEALEHFREAVRLKSDYFDAHFNLASVLHHGRNADLEEAAKHYEEALRLNPNSLRVLLNFGELEYQRSSWARSLKLFEWALRIEPKLPQAHLGKGSALLALHKVDESIDALLRALELQPDLGPANEAAADAYKMKGDIESAITYYQKALEARPAVASVRLKLAKALIQMGRKDEALLELKDLLTLVPPDDIQYEAETLVKRLSEEVSQEPE